MLRRRDGSPVSLPDQHVGRSCRREGLVAPNGRRRPLSVHQVDSSDLGASRAYIKTSPDLQVIRGRFFRFLDEQNRQRFLS